MLFCCWLLGHTLAAEREMRGSPKLSTQKCSPSRNHLHLENYSPDITSLQLKTITERTDVDGTRRLPADNCWERQGGSGLTPSWSALVGPALTLQLVGCKILLTNLVCQLGGECYVLYHCHAGTLDCNQCNLLKPVQPVHTSAPVKTSALVKSIYTMRLQRWFTPHNIRTMSGKNPTDPSWKF